MALADIQSEYDDIPFDPDMVYEIVELKRLLEKKGIVYLDVDDGRGLVHERPFTLQPAISKCSRCGFRTAISK
jgi:hypothetical protein